MKAQDAQIRLAQKNVTEAGAFRPYLGRKRGDKHNFQGASLPWKVSRQQGH